MSTSKAVVVVVSQAPNKVPVVFPKKFAAAVASVYGTPRPGNVGSTPKPDKKEEK